MAEYQGQHGHAKPRVDEYGNPVGQGTAGYGATGTGTHGMGPGAGYGASWTGAHGATGYPHGGAAATTGVGGQFQPVREEHKTGGILHRSGSSSSSSSSSEDDGEGGRRKGIKEKIKEKVPGTQEHQERKATGTTSTGYGQGHMGNTAAGTTGTHMGESGEKKGIMDKIKEKLPGHQ